MDSAPAIVNSTAVLLATAMDPLVLPGGSGPGPGAGGPAHISIPGLGLAALVILVNGLVSAWLHLGMQGRLAVGTVRVVLQLSVLGYVLVPIFKADRADITSAYLCFMLMVAAVESQSRPALAYRGMLRQVLISLAVPCAAVLAYALAVVIRPSPWYAAQYIIPVAGMLLGNACSGVAIGLSSVLDDFSAGRDRVECLLAAGATRWEAARGPVAKAVRTALTPTLNQMNVAGIVAIPGMMTGQILGGADPSTAARYQAVLLLFIAAASGAASVATVFFATGTLLDGCHRLRSDLLVRRGVGEKGILAWMAWQVKRVWHALRGGSASDADGHVGASRSRARLLPRNGDGRSGGGGDLPGNGAGDVHEPLMDRERR